MFANYHRNQMEESTIDQRPAKGTRCTHTHVRRRRMDDSCGVRIRQIRTGQTGCHLRTASKSQTKPNASTLSLVFGPKKLGNIQSCRRLFYDFRGRQRRARLGPPNRRRRPAGDAEHQLKPDGPPSTLLQTSASRPPGPFHSFPDATLGAGQKSQRRRFFFFRPMFNHRNNTSVYLQRKQPTCVHTPNPMICCKVSSNQMTLTVRSLGKFSVCK